jgi:parallel beta-helix repeat protein
MLGVSGGAPGALQGDTDTAFTFNGAGYTQDSQPLTVGTSFSVEAWIKATAGSGDGTAVSLAASGISAARTIYVTGAGRIIGMADHSGSWPTYSVTSPQLDTTTWHHVVFTSQGNTLTLFVDGKSVASASPTGVQSGYTGNARVGWTSSTWMPHFKGSIDEVALYPTALSPSQVAVHFAAGSAGACARTLQSLVDAAAAGSTLTVPACVYRETVTINKPLTVVGTPGSEIRGSDIWASWAPSGSAFVSTNAVPTLPAVSDDTHACDASLGGRCMWPEQVFRDGAELHQVAAGTVPASGQFALVSAADRRVLLGDNPTGHRIEVSVRTRWILTASNGVTLRGLIMRHAANSAVVGALSNNGYSNWTVQNSTLASAHASDIDVRGGSNVQVLNNDIGAAGLDGLSGSGITQGGLVQGNKIHDSRTTESGFNANWGGGGLKLTGVTGFVVDGNEVYSNLGIGIWCDVGCSNVTISNNRIHNNQWQGINFEVSDGAKIHDNAAWENGWGKNTYGWGAGIVVSTAANAEIYNNTVAWNYAGVSIIAQNRPDAIKGVNHYVHDNVIVKKTVTGDFSATFWQNLSLAWLSGDGAATAYLFDPASNNRGSNNQVWYDLPENLSVRFSWTAQYLNLSQFAPTPGGAGTTYMSTAAMNAALSAKGIPLTQAAH